MAPPTKGHPSYQAPPTKGHPSYQASFRSTEIVNTAKLSPSKKNMIIYTLSKMIITLYCGNEVYLLAKTVSQIRMTIPTTVFKSNSYGYTHHCLQVKFVWLYPPLSSIFFITGVVSQRTA